MIGEKLSNYEIEELIGSGGMGDVYRARDLRLGRNVAVKVLPDVFAKDAERLGRFEREARVLASLNHANIAILHGFERAGDTHFLVMELVEGETLAERLARGPMPVKEALGVARQIAEALEAAHEKGIIHRDLKPANVKITPDGKVKVLDFGLAKAMGEANAGNAALSNSPTMLSMAATNAGMILGTAAYMSPEQARGENTDARTDIFAFGCVLYEMLTSRPSFQGKTVSDVLASVLARDPDLTLLPPNINPRLVRLLQRCLNKEAKSRWHAIADVRVEMESILDEPVVAPQDAHARRPLRSLIIPALIAGLVFSAITALVVLRLRPAPAPADITRFPYVLPDSQTFSNPGRHLVAISSDGREMVYIANQRLYLRLLSGNEARPIPGTEAAGNGVTDPAFSPDGKSVVFWSGTDQMLKRIAVTGGAAVTICPADNLS